MTNDYISRQDAIDAFYKYPNVHWTTLDVMNEISKVPSAQRKGKWILHQDSRTWECSECHKYQVISSDYCIHCGADMRGE